MTIATMDPNREQLGELLHEVTGGRLLSALQVQVLWGGYGELIRCRLEGAAEASVVVKHVRWPTESDHPRGWNTNRSHARKVRSYQVETCWYTDYAQRCSSLSRVPRCLAIRERGDEVFIVLEDLDDAGFGGRRSRVGDDELRACLHWLANFHATFIACAPDGLWPVGTYWHLETRPDELAALEDGPLKRGAARMDDMLTSSRFLTLVHGDAKLANFCFSKDGMIVAAVDFQYVGGGCGIKDVAYFLSSCLDEQSAEEREDELLDIYFEALRRAVESDNRSAAGNGNNAVDSKALCDDWRALYPVAWTDFYRFLKGWSPGHWKIHRYSERLAREVLDTLAVDGRVR